MYFLFAFGIVEYYKTLVTRNGRDENNRLNGAQEQTYYKGLIVSRDLKLLTIIGMDVDLCLLKQKKKDTE